MPTFRPGHALLALMLVLGLPLTSHAQPSRSTTAPLAAAHVYQAEPADQSSQTGLTAVFSSNQVGIRLAYPANWLLQHTPDPAYLLSSQWKLYANTDANPGQPVVSLTLPASNRVTTAQLRIGVSHRPVSLRSCTDTPQATVAGSTGHATIDGVAFTTFTARDAGMSHYMTVQGYRAVHNGLCYALDVVIYGTNPKVYDPPRTPPFSHEQALAQLTPVVTGLSFTTPPLDQRKQ